MPQSIFFLLTHKSLLGWSSLLFVVTALFTIVGFQTVISFITDMTNPWFAQGPDNSTIWGMVKYYSWYGAKLLFILTTRIIAFYLAFLLAFSLTTPGYVMLSSATSKKQAGQHADFDNAFTLSSILRDLKEGLKVGALGILVAIAALASAFIPVIGQVVVFLLYAFYSTLMFLDYPTSQRGWPLNRKLDWLSRHRITTLRIGWLPSLISMIPVLNIFLLALLFPILTVHTTLNFNNIESMKQK